VAQLGIAGAHVVGAQQLGVQSTGAAHVGCIKQSVGVAQLGQQSLS